MDKENIILNFKLVSLIRTFETLGIACIIHNSNTIEILFKDNHTDLIFNAITSIENETIGFELKINKYFKEKSIKIKFIKDFNTTCDQLIYYLKTPKANQNTNIFYDLFYILENYDNKKITLTIQKNFDISQGFLAIFKTKITKEEFKKQSIINNNSNLNSRIIHKIYIPTEDNKYDVTYRLLYKDELDLKNLLSITKKETKIKMLLK